MPFVSIKRHEDGDGATEEGRQRGKLRLSMMHRASSGIRRRPPYSAELGGEFERPRTPEQILDKLEERIGSKGREIFENFVREINRLAGRRDWSKEVDRKR